MSEYKPRDPLKLDHAQEVLGYFEQIEGQFAQVREGLTHLQRLATLGTLSAMVAHEFNNILTPVISYTQMALANPDDRDLSRTALETALSGADRAADPSTSRTCFSRQDHTRARTHLNHALPCPSTASPLGLTGRSYLSLGTVRVWTLVSTRFRSSGRTRRSLRVIATTPRLFCEWTWRPVTPTKADSTL